ncbi:MAG: hypothetical protein N2045_04420 [Fimbriimonadales bacterium]|jgi:ABC-type Fe3+ transport system permease subunit|nr:hypothetical protein [Fimbriimonadales bacterium]CUU03645.1 hypothetical protein GBSOP10_102815 [Armatimonadetes bacterium GBS]CUU36435.1 hypothetical protein DCOP10_11740 [Armatimonadetes bacterium DC]CUU36450.1 hypothetical protein GXSOP10_123101 [Armatimonadetes bacterium GXS]GBC89970.1 hypothetical protein HRbin14_00702 [bacterium HR14]
MKPHRDWLGRIFALLILLVGVGLMLLCFGLAYQMFQTPPQRLMNNPQTNSPDLNSLVTGVWASVRSILLLVLMAIVGGMIANRGITLYLHVRRAEYEERQQQEKNPPT